MWSLMNKGVMVRGGRGRRFGRYGGVHDGDKKKTKRPSGGSVKLKRGWGLSY